MNQSSLLYVDLPDNNSRNVQGQPPNVGEKGIRRLKSNVHSYPRNVLLADGSSLLENSNYPFESHNFHDKTNYPFIQNHFHQQFVDSVRHDGKNMKPFEGLDDTQSKVFFSNSEEDITQKSRNVHKSISSNTFQGSGNGSINTRPSFDHLQLHNLPPCKSITQSDIGDLNDCKIILEAGPGCHQIKEYNIRPVNVIRVNYTPRNSDILVVKLMCDPAMKLKDCEVFLTAMSPKFQTDDSDRLYLPNLKISKDMLKGRTKGYKFNLVYSLFIKGEESFRLVSESFFLWSNVNQNGFPREERDSYTNSECQSSNKKRKRSVS